MHRRKDSRRRAWLFFFLLLVAAAALGGLLFRASLPWPIKPLPPLSAMHTIAGAAGGDRPQRFGDPFGVSVAEDGTVYVTDHVTDKDRGQVWQIVPDASPRIIAGNLNVPSAIALAADGTLIVADTGSHTIKRINPQNGETKIIAGAENQSGFADGPGSEARFNAPVGVTVAKDGHIFVADTYNDRIRVIDPQNRVYTIAGGPEPGFADSAVGSQARFDTPCGIAIAGDGWLVVADTGNHRVRRVQRDGAVTTIAGTGEDTVRDGSFVEAAFNEPTGVAVDREGVIYVTDAGGSALRVSRFNDSPGGGTVTTLVGLAGGGSAGLVDGPIEQALLNRPAGIAVARDGMIVVADAGNKLVRAVVGENREQGAPLTSEAAVMLRLTAEEMRRAGEPRWPYDPPVRAREIAATFGEIRGVLSSDPAENTGPWFHNGLDVPGGYGETVRLLRAERILRPLSVTGIGTARERIRFPLLGYVHLRVGRHADDREFGDERFIIGRDAAGRVARVRVRRGARFAAGDAIGTLNNQNHVHLMAGPTGAEMNALAALALPDVKDTVAPTIEQNGVRLFDREWKEFQSVASTVKAATGHGPKTGIVEVHGDVRIVVQAYDQMDGNATRRRLGVYRLGYQILNADQTPLPQFAEPFMTISFESLPDDSAAVPLVYAVGSQAGYTGKTVFAYIVTNTAREREVREDFWCASTLAPGEYIVRVFAEDFFGNRATHDVEVRVTASASSGAPS